MSRRNLSLQRRCAWWLNECLRLGWEKSQLPALEKLFWKYKPWNAKKMAKARTAKLLARLDSKGRVINDEN